MAHKPELEPLVSEYEQYCMYWEQVGVRALQRYINETGKDWLSLSSDDWKTAQLYAKSSNPSHYLRMTNGAANFLEWCIKQGIDCQVSYANIKTSRMVPSGDAFRKEFYYGSTEEFEKDLLEDYQATGYQNSPNLPVLCALILAWHGFTTAQVDILLKKDVLPLLHQSETKMCVIQNQGNPDENTLLTGISAELILAYREATTVVVVTNGAARVHQYSESLKLFRSYRTDFIDASKRIQALKFWNHKRSAEKKRQFHLPLVQDNGLYVRLWDKLNRMGKLDMIVDVERAFLLYHSEFDQMLSIPGAKVGSQFGNFRTKYLPFYEWCKAFRE